MRKSRTRRKARTCALCAWRPPQTCSFFRAASRDHLHVGAAEGADLPAEPRGVPHHGAARLTAAPRALSAGASANSGRTELRSSIVRTPGPGMPGGCPVGTAQLREAAALGRNLPARISSESQLITPVLNSCSPARKFDAVGGPAYGWQPLHRRYTPGQPVLVLRARARGSWTFKLAPG
jgi:hypothetical protein